MALKSALDLPIAYAIDHHGGTATLPQIAEHAALPPWLCSAFVVPNLLR
jgi:hypothetical protein